MAKVVYFLVCLFVFNLFSPATAGTAAKVVDTAVEATKGAVSFAGEGLQRAGTFIQEKLDKPRNSLELPNEYKERLIALAKIFKTYYTAEALTARIEQGNLEVDELISLLEEVRDIFKPEEGGQLWEFLNTWVKIAEDAINEYRQIPCTSAVLKLEIQKKIDSLHKRQLQGELAKQTVSTLYSSFDLKVKKYSERLAYAKLTKKTDILCADFDSLMLLLSEAISFVEHPVS